MSNQKRPCNEPSTKLSSASALPVITTTRTRQFTPSSVSRHFLVFDPAISRTQRILFQLAIVSSHFSEDMSVVLPPYSPTQLLELRVINNVAHPAHGQIGLFAKVGIPRDTVVTAYSGIVEYCRALTGSRTYTMGFGSTASNDFVVDGEVVGDYGRFANDPRNTGRQDNVVAISRTSKLGETFTAIVTKRTIVAGEELLLNYGKQHQMFATQWFAHDGTSVTRPRRVSHLPFPKLSPESERRLHVQLELFWHCAYCQWWNPRHSSSALVVPICEKCESPCIPRSRLCAALVQHSKAAASKLDEKQDTPLDSEKSEAKEHRPVKRERSPASGNDIDEEARRVESRRHQNAAARTGDNPASTFLTRWPITIPFVSWSIWDPAIPVGRIYEYSTYTHWHGIDGRVNEAFKPCALLATQAFQRGAVVGPVGGIVVTRAYAERVGQFDYPWLPLPRILPQPDEQNRCSSCMSEQDEILPQLALIVTNEFSCCAGIAKRGDSGKGSAAAANLDLAFVRDDLGAIYVGAIALRHIQPYDELVYCPSFT